MGVIIVKVFLVWEGFCRLCSNAMLGYIYADALHPSIEKNVSTEVYNYNPCEICKTVEGQVA